ncbi:C-type lectin domain family 17, member A-like [Scomber scombrus]|uniref:C-type lectin domain family 17, member A-like n=1 Tax=Scomber scombrus TaxID=13677 RepID=UPI002DD98CF3|nr:C-type lectin domain family 17, member A-like [Scomber scombrus]
MAVFFNSSESEVSFEVGVYEEIPKPESKDTTADKASKPKLSYFRVVLVSFGLLCVLQAILNIALRLTMSQSTETGATEGESCPQDWLMFESSCYYISPQRKNWNDSRRYCLQNDADLVIINSTQEQAFLTGFAMAVWIGMTDRAKEGTWIWVNGKPVDRNGYPWERGSQPDSDLGLMPP